VTTNRSADYSFLNLRLVPDLKPGRGALGGLYTAIASASNPLVAVVACDMPFASPNFFEAAAKMLVEEEVDVVIARTASEAGKSGQGYEPLHAVYRREACLPAIEAAIDADQWKVIAWFPQVRVRVLTFEEVKRYDPSGLAFWNVNTPEEFLEAERIAQS
jgi:molybdopterin-guanine dinucleotide biosynthesis protein A